MKLACLISWFVFLYAGLVSAAPETIEIWPEGRMPGRGSDKPEAERPSKDEFHRITHVSRPTLTVFPSPRKQSPAVIVCPGGGYGYVVIDKEGTEIAAWLNRHGITALVLKYRNPDNREGALQDLQRACRITRSRAAEWNADPAKVGVMGFSAGGHLSARASNLKDPSYALIDAVDQLRCQPDFAVLVYPAYLEMNGKLAPELAVSAHTPPTFLVHNEDDAAFIAGSKVYAAALAANKVPHRFALFANGGHGYGLHCKGEARVWPEQCAEWLTKR
ncbi:MAG: alpha/beta hydrolase [Akkermansiaceae bacterium]|jgi:acetyl esterase/lipase|nr:alpha/beta hydrolase [Akkermansiaceae bacterium]